MMSSPPFILLLLNIITLPKTSFLSSHYLIQAHWVNTNALDGQLDFKVLFVMIHKIEDAFGRLSIKARTPNTDRLLLLAGKSVFSEDSVVRALGT